MWRSRIQGKTEIIKDTCLDLGMPPLVCSCSGDGCPKTVDDIKAIFDKCQGCPVIFDEFNGMDADLIGKFPEACPGQRVGVAFNPGVEGKTEIPAAFLEKCVVQDMTVPDRKLLLEVRLFAKGFRQGDKLAQAMIEAGKDKGLREFINAIDELGTKAANDWAAVGEDEVNLLA